MNKALTAEQAAEYLKHFPGMQLTHLEMVEGSDQVRYMRLLDPDTEKGGEYIIDGAEVHFRTKQPVFAGLIDDVISMWDEHAAKNYVSFTASSRKQAERGPFEVVIRPLWGTKSVGEVNAELKARVAELEQQNTEWRRKFERIKAEPRTPDLLCQDINPEPADLRWKRKVEHERRHRKAALQRVKRLQAHIKQLLAAHWNADVRIHLLHLTGALPPHCAGTGALYGVTAAQGAERVVAQVQEWSGFESGKEARYLRQRVEELARRVLDLEGQRFNLIDENVLQRAVLAWIAGSCCGSEQAAAALLMGERWPLEDPTCLDGMPPELRQELLEAKR